MDERVKTAKQILLEHANQNPLEVLVVTNVNGQLRMNTKYENMASGLFMLYQLERTVKDWINNNSPLDIEVPSGTQN